jgi:hypothetical protein
MSFEEFQTEVEAGRFPTELNAPLQALWHEARGDWAGAHACVQEDNSPAASWVHAYLHRREGDAGNAAYWYARARRPVATGSLEAEWAAIARELLGG